MLVFMLFSFILTSSTLRNDAAPEFDAANWPATLAVPNNILLAVKLHQLRRYETTGNVIMRRCQLLLWLCPSCLCVLERARRSDSAHDTMGDDRLAVKV